MRAPWPENGPQRKWECCLYAVKGKKAVLKMAADLVTYNPDANLGHAAQKPVALFQDLLPFHTFFPFQGLGFQLPGVPYFMSWA